MSEAERRLAHAGYIIPAPPAPGASYIPIVQEGSLLFVSGQVPLIDGQMIYTGKVGRELDIAAGQEAARVCALNALGALRKHLGNLDRVKQIVKMNGYVQCAADFEEQHLVINAASDLFILAFGEHGAHARTAVGTNALPLNAATEIELTVSLKET